jgi:hypothetical protein
VLCLHFEFAHIPPLGIVSGKVEGENECFRMSTYFSVYLNILKNLYRVQVIPRTFDRIYIEVAVCILLVSSKPSQMFILKPF